MARPGFRTRFSVGTLAALAVVGASLAPSAHSADRVYWANFSKDKISFANLDGSGGGDLATTGATVDGPVYPSLLKVPSGAGAPAISGGSALASVLSCSQGAWAADLLGSFLYRAPQSFAFQWSLNGAQIAGAIATSFTADLPGAYRCAVSASNAAGTTTQTSDPFIVSSPTPSNDISFGRLTRNTSNGTATLIVNVPGPGELTMRGRGVAPLRSRGERKPRRAVSGGKVRLKIRPRGAARRKLNNTGSAKVKVSVTFTPTGGTANTEAKRVRLVKR